MDFCIAVLPLAFLNHFEAQARIECLGAGIGNGHIQNTFSQPDPAGKLDLVLDECLADTATAEFLTHTQLKDQSGIRCKRRDDAFQMASALRHFHDMEWAIRSQSGPGISKIKSQAVPAGIKCTNSNNLVVYGSHRMNSMALSS